MSPVSIFTFWLDRFFRTRSLGPLCKFCFDRFTICLRWSRFCQAPITSPFLADTRGAAVTTEPVCGWQAHALSLQSGSAAFAAGTRAAGAGVLAPGTNLPVTFAVHWNHPLSLPVQVFVFHSLCASIVYSTFQGDVNTKSELKLNNM